MGVRAAVIVSGGGSTSPFTTPDQACGAGLAAGDTDTAIREALLCAGIAAFTAPVAPGGVAVAGHAGWAAFTDPPAVLPADLTVDSTGDIEESAGCLVRFLNYLNEQYGVTDVDVVAHSLGGVIARSAHMQLQKGGGPVGLVSLTSIGSPWLGSFVRRCLNAGLALPMPEPAASYAASLMGGMRARGALVAEGNGAPVWAEGKEHGLDGLALVRIAGTYFAGDGEIGPHDGMIDRVSAWAVDGDPVVFPVAQCHEVPDVHSISFAKEMDLAWEKSITWDPVVMDIVVEGIRAV